jgi:hypothetical protein
METHRVSCETSSSHIFLDNWLTHGGEAERLQQLNNFFDLIGNGTRDLLACSIVPQLSALLQL